MRKNRRKHFLIDKKLQFRYVFYIVATLAVVTSVSMAGSYFGIWASVVDAFSEETIRESIVTAAQMNEYEQARRPLMGGLAFPSIRVIQETTLLSERQKETIRQIMDETNQRTLGLLALLLFFIGWGSIFLTHKIAGPMFKLGQYFKELENGNLAARIQFRKFDEGHHLARQFNEMAAKLDASVGKMKRTIHQMPSETVSEELKIELSKFKTTSE